MKNAKRLTAALREPKPFEASDQGKMALATLSVNTHPELGPRQVALGPNQSNNTQGPHCIGTLTRMDRHLISESVTSRSQPKPATLALSGGPL